MKLGLSASLSWPVLNGNGNPLDPTLGGLVLSINLIHFGTWIFSHWAVHFIYRGVLNELKKERKKGEQWQSG